MFSYAAARSLPPQLIPPAMPISSPWYCKLTRNERIWQLRGAGRFVILEHRVLQA